MKHKKEENPKAHPKYLLQIFPMFVRVCEDLISKLQDFLIFKDPMSTIDCHGQGLQLRCQRNEEIEMLLS